MDLQREIAYHDPNWVHGKFFIQVRGKSAPAEKQPEQQTAQLPEITQKQQNAAEQQKATAQQAPEKIFYLGHYPQLSNNVLLQGFTGHNDQQWLFENGNTIRNVKTDKVIEVVGKTTQVSCGELVHSLSQKWSFDGGVITSCMNTQYAIDVNCSQLSAMRSGLDLCLKKKGSQIVAKIELIPVPQHFESSKTSDKLLQYFSDKKNITMINVLDYINRFGEKQSGIFNFLVNKLYEIGNLDEVEFYLPQLLNIYVTKTSEENSFLECFILDKCSQSLHFGFLLIWLLDAELPQAGIQPALLERGKKLRKAVEQATINRQLPKRLMHLKGNTAKSVEDEEGDSQIVKRSFDWLLRQNFFADELQFIQTLANISLRLKVYPTQLRNEKLRSELANLNKIIPVGCYLPICKSNELHERVLSIVTSECVALPTKERVPYMFFCETLKTEFNTFNPQLTEEYIANEKPTGSPTLQDLESSIQIDKKGLLKRTKSYDADFLRKGGLTLSSSMDFITNQPIFCTPATMIGFAKEDIGKQYNNDQLLPPASSSLASPLAFSGDSDDFVIIDKQAEEQAERKALLYAVYGESFEERKHRIRASSPFGYMKNWSLRSCIVKANDDLRQERLAMQIIMLFQEIFRSEELPIQLVPYHISVAGEDCGLIETVVDTVSLSSLKKKFPQYVSLRDYFKKVYGPESSPTFREAQRNFTESIAGYSVVTYLLQIKDRHNGNILLHRLGHLIHIDFGFMLANSPGAINFESAPFKLPMDFVDVMGGVNSDMFKHYSALVFLAFQKAAKHHEKFVSLVEMILPGLNFPCFMGDGLKVLNDFRERFHSHLSEADMAKWVKSLIDESVDNWRTTYYDNFQKLTNNIL